MGTRGSESIFCGSARSAAGGALALEQEELSTLWHVLYAKSRQEKALADDLGELGIAHYLPLIKDLRFYGGRSYRVQLPLFPGYLFVNGTKEHLHKCMRTRRVVRVIPVSDQEQIEWELSNIKLALEMNAKLRPHRVLDRGCRVEVRSGPFKGVQGIVENAVNMNRIVFQVNMLGRAVSMEIDERVLDLLTAL